MPRIQRACSEVPRCGFPIQKLFLFAQHMGSLERKHHGYFHLLKEDLAGLTIKGVNLMKGLLTMAHEGSRSLTLRFWGWTLEP